MCEQAKLGGKLKLRLSGIKPAKDRVESRQRRCNDSTCSFWLACLFLSNPTCFSLTYQLKSFRSNLSKITERVLSISHEGMARLLCGCLFILQIRQWHWTWKAFLSIKNYFYQHQNIAIIIKGECDRCPISDVAVIIFPLKFVGSFGAATFSFTNFFFPPNRFSLLYSGRSLCCLLHFTPTASRKKTSSPKNLSSLWAQCETLKGLAEDYARKFYQEANGSKLFKRWLAQLSECLWAEIVCEAGKSFQRCFLETIFSPEGTL